MESHNHPAYEETFQRIATILDVMAEEQNDLQRGQAELQRGHAEMQRAQTSAFAAIERLSIKFEQQIEEARARDAEFTKRINALAERDAETTDKINALIDLVDRRINERGDTQP